MVRPAACLFALACAAPTAWTPAACPQPAVLVTIDGVRPDEVWSGRWPHLEALAARGVAWPEARASGPNFVSLPGYREILTGRPTRGCVDNGCGLADEPTLLDELAARGDAAAVIASWETIENAAAIDPTKLPLTAGRHGGATRAAFRAASPDLDDAESSPAFPGLGDYRPDRYTGALALAYLQSARPCFLYVSLGDTDEYAHRRDYPSYLVALGEFDAFLGDLEATLSAMGGRFADAVIVVTTDHGRERAFQHHGADGESSRVWIVAAGGPILPHTTQEQPQLCAVAPLVRELVGLPADRSAFACAPLH